MLFVQQIMIRPHEDNIILGTKLKIIFAKRY